MAFRACTRVFVDARGEIRIHERLGIDCVLLVLSILLPVVGHVAAFPKADMRGTGPGFDIALMNEKTVRAQAAWHYFNRHWWMHVVYSAGAVALYVFLRARSVRLIWRLPIMLVISLPALWYFDLSSYLGGKILWPM